MSGQGHQRTYTDVIQPPVLKLGPLLMVSIQMELSDALAELLQDTLLEEIQEHRAEGVLLDITALDVVDTFICRVITETTRMCKLLGARLVLVGLQPAVTMTLLEMGMNLAEIESAMDMEAGLNRLGYELRKCSHEEP